MQATRYRQRGGRPAADSGAILVVVLIAIVALLGLGMTGLFLTSGSIQVNTNINLRNQALVVAEAGIERARLVLSNPSYTPPIPTFLAGTGGSGVEVPQSTSQCDGEMRGAILIDPLCAGAPCLLSKVIYPSVDRTQGLPTSAGTIASQSLGTYTVYIRQDLADCRMGNFVCDQSPPSTLPQGGAVGAFGVTTCSAPAGAPQPNNAIVVRSEGVASDNRTRVVLEVTMMPAQGTQQVQNPPVSALCSAGAQGCDDNSSVQNGIVVNSTAPQTAPPPQTYGGAGGAAQGGTTGAGGAGGTAGTMVGTGAGGTNSGGAGGSGGMGAGGTGGKGGTGGNTSCPNASCAKIAILGVPGVWDPNTNASDPSSGWAKFDTWLGTHSDNCQNPTLIDIDSTTITSLLLSQYNVLILLDLFHTKVERGACVATTNFSNCKGQACYLTDGSNGLCTGATATYTSTATSTDVRVMTGCPTANTFTGTVTRTSTATGTGTGTVARSVGGTTVSATGTYSLTSTGTGTATGTATVTCRYPPGLVAGNSYPTSPAYVTSYNYGSARILNGSELSAINSWVQQGGGIATTTGYFYNAAETTNVNNILAMFNLKYQTSYQAGHIVTLLGGVYGGGVDIGRVNASINDFMPGVPPFNYKSTVNLLQMRAATPLQKITGGSGNVYLAAEVDYSCPVGNTNYGISNCNYSQATCTALSSPADVGFYVDNIGPGGGRVVAWSDEWLTYDTVWNTVNSCGTQQYQPDRYWDNVVRYLGHCSN